MKVIKVREQQGERGGREKEGRRHSLMTRLKMSCYTRHFPCGSLELIPENRDLQSSRITCHTTGGLIHINIRVCSKLVSKSVLAVLMCMNESLSASETVRVYQRGGE